MKLVIKKAAALLCGAILLAQMALIQVFAAQTVTFSLSCTPYTPGSSITVSCNVDTAPDIGGFVMELQCDKSVFAYTENSFKSANTALMDAAVHYNSATGVLHIVWETAAGTGLHTAGNLFTVNFKVAESASAPSYVFTPRITECYTADPVPKNLRVAGVQGTSLCNASAAALALIQKINAIGSVTADDACLQKILEAEAAYKALSALERRQVTNYSSLLAAREEYDLLHAQAIETAEKQAADAYRSAYAVILGKTVETLALNDKTTLEAALTAWNNLSTNAQKALLIDEKNHLNKLNTRMQELIKIEQGRLKEEELKKEALDFKQNLNHDWAQVLSLTPETVTPDFAEPVGLALQAANGYCLMNSYCNIYLKDEINLLNSLADKIAELKGADENTGFNAATFLKYYGWLTQKSVNDVTLADAEDIKVAYQLIQLLDAAAQAELNDVFAKLETFMVKIASLEAEQPDDEPRVVTITETVNSEVLVPGSSTYNMQTGSSDVWFTGGNIDALRQFKILLLVIRLASQR